MSYKIAVISPFSEGMIHKQYHRSVLSLKRPEGVTELMMKTPDALEVDVVLNTSINQALRENATHIFSWEADVNVPPQTLQYLLKDDVPVVSGLLFQKVYPNQPIVYNYVDNQESRYMMSPVWDYDDGYAGKKGLRLVDVVGAGCLLIKAEVFKKIDMPYFKFLKGDPACKDGSSISADNYFCRKLKDARIPVFVDTRVCCGHLYVGEATEDDWLRNKKQYFEGLKNEKTN